MENNKESGIKGLSVLLFIIMLVGCLIYAISLFKVGQISYGFIVLIGGIFLSIVELVFMLAFGDIHEKVILINEKINDMRKEVSHKNIPSEKIDDINEMIHTILYNEGMAILEKRIRVKILLEDKKITQEEYDRAIGIINDIK